MKEDILSFPLTTNLSAKGTKICNDDMEYGNLKKTSVVITLKNLSLTQIGLAEGNRQN